MKPHLYTLTIASPRTRSAPMRFSEAARALAAYYEEGHVNVTAYIGEGDRQRPTTLDEARRLTRRAKEFVGTAERDASA